ncbi:exonuclease domain-containing protein [Poseidonocella sp. HB161398]|uniref:exonuclease domain-containing protein n=1 Tax=Poseidonocella sp. HB161398 TaxID=2320855 RepID=UPI0011082501|nr:exonuclease domain-containing protein [Poseidonocella sp. HB161398]
MDLVNRRSGAGEGVAPALPEGPFRFVVLDVETANSDPSSISQIGLACVRADGGIEVFASYVDPCCRFSSFNIQLTGIRPETVRGAPRFAEMLPPLCRLLDGLPVIQHSSFDRRAIGAASAEAGLAPPDWDWHDSLPMARRAWPEFKGQGGHGLGHLKERLSLDFEHHDAGEDARATAQVVLMAEDRLGCDFRQIAARPAARAKPRPAAPRGLEGVVVFAGQMAMPREEAAAQARAAGLSVQVNVTRSITLLVVGDADLHGTPDRRHRRVQEMRAAGHKVAILGESAFLAMLARRAVQP